MGNKLWIVTIAFLCGSTLLRAQESSYPQQLNEFGLWGGYAPLPSQLLGTTSDHQLIDIGLRYGRVLKAGGNVKIDYTLGACPRIELNGVGA